MPRIYCFKNCAETVNEEFREKSEIVSLDFAVLRYTLRLRIDVFYSLTVVFFFFHSFLKEFRLIFPGYTRHLLSIVIQFQNYNEMALLLFVML